MRVVIKGGIGKLRRMASFSTSGAMHAAILGYIAFGALWEPPRPAQSIYDMTIRPSEKKIVWYHIQEKLPEIRPPQTRAPKQSKEPRPLRALKKFNQEIVAGIKDDARPPQLVWAPAPEVAAPKMPPLPNVVAVEQKPLTKKFT